MAGPAEGSATRTARRRRGFRPDRLSITGAVGRRGCPELEGRGLGGTLQRDASVADRPDWWAAVKDRTWGGPVRKALWRRTPGAGGPAGGAPGPPAGWGVETEACAPAALRFTVCRPGIRSKPSPPKAPRGAPLTPPRSLQPQIPGIYSVTWLVF